MKTYELTYIISSEITVEEAQAQAKIIDSFIQEKEGVILRSENPVAKTLSYPIKKQGSGFFVIAEFQIPPEKLSELKEKLEKDNKILRHFIIIKKPVKFRKERRTKKVFSTPEFETKLEEPSFIKVSEEKEETKTEKKVELNDIEKKLDEILGE